jgi:two-component system sensor histidine kinase DesK
MVGLLFALTLPQIAVLGVDGSSLWIYVGVAGGLLFSARWALALGVALAAGMLLLDAVAGQPLSWELALTLVALTAFMVGFAGNIKLNIRLRETQEQLAVAAVAAERERIGRDLHDILGHSLTAIAVKAGLARRLLDRDSAAAAMEIADVERLAREALADVRATASGYRDVSLAAELAVAGSVLRAAGIRAELPGAVDDVDPGAREAFGFVVREAVTNVIRHTDASVCTVTVGPSWVEVVDNGSGRARMASGAAGAGLRGLTERVAALGGRVTAGPRVGGGFAVHADVPVSPSHDETGSAHLSVPADPAGGTRQ